MNCEKLKVIQHSMLRNISGILTYFQTYLGAFNFGTADTELPIQVSSVKNKELHQAIVIAFSSNAKQYHYRQMIDLSSGTVTVPSEQGVVFKFSF